MASAISISNKATEWLGGKNCDKAQLKYQFMEPINTILKEISEKLINNAS